MLFVDTLYFLTEKVEKHAFYIKLCHNVANGYMRKTAGADKKSF